MKRAAIRKVKNPKKETTKMPAAQESFYRTKEYFAHQNKLIAIVQDTLPEGITFSQKEKIARISFRKLQLEQELDTIKKSSLSKPEKEDLSKRYIKWIKNYNDFLKNIERGK